MSSPRSLVYFTYLGDEDTHDDMVARRLSFMDRQLRWLADLIGASGVRTAVLVPYVAPRSWDGEVHRLVETYGFRIDAASIDGDRCNSFEYRGFRALNALAGASAPDALIYYCHSKGIVHLEENKMGLFKLHTRIGLTADLAPLEADPLLTRAGIFPYKFGWCWYNFFWIKAAYMAGLAVERSADRYHFEALIGDRGDKQAYRRVLPLADRAILRASGIAVQPWYRPEETVTTGLSAVYDRYAGLASPDADGC